MTFPVHWHPTVEISQFGRLEVEGRETRKLVLGDAHGNAPRCSPHFVPGGATIENMSLDIFYGPATVLDFSEVPDKTEISAQMLQEKIGDTVTGRVLLPVRLGPTARQPRILLAPSIPDRRRLQLLGGRRNQTCRVRFTDARRSTQWPWSRKRLAEPPDFVGKRRFDFGILGEPVGHSRPGVRFIRLPAQNFRR